MNAKMLKVCGYMAAKQMTVPFAKDRKRWPAMKVLAEFTRFLSSKEESFALDAMEWTLERLEVEVDCLKRLESIRHQDDFSSSLPLTCAFCRGKGSRARDEWDHELFCPWCNATGKLTERQIDEILPKPKEKKRRVREKVESKKISAPVPK